MPNNLEGPKYAHLFRFFSVYFADYMDLQCGTSLYMPNLYHLYSLRLKLTSNYNYRKNMNCVFTVNTTSSQHLMFYFKDMDIEYSTSCSRDWLELHDGGSLYSSYVPGKLGKNLYTALYLEEKKTTTIPSPLYYILLFTLYLYVMYVA